MALSLPQPWATPHHHISTKLGQSACLSKTPTYEFDFTYLDSDLQSDTRSLAYTCALGPRGCALGVEPLRPLLQSNTAIETSWVFSRHMPTMLISKLYPHIKSNLPLRGCRAVHEYSTSTQYLSDAALNTDVSAGQKSKGGTRETHKVRAGTSSKTRERRRL